MALGRVGAGWRRWGTRFLAGSSGHLVVRTTPTYSFCG